jgi:hypothetical protein
MAYWIMIAVALSGFVGRYIYSQIPRSLSAAGLSIKDLESSLTELARVLETQSFFSPEALRPLFDAPSREDVERMSLADVFAGMIALDVGCLIHVAVLRRRCLTTAGRLFTLAGLLPSSHAELETEIQTVCSQAWLSTRIAFLQRAHRIFYLWHVVHRPFSYSFAVLVVVHITVVVMPGYS